MAEQWGPCDRRTLSQRSNLSEEEVLERVAQLVANGDMIVLGDLAADNDAVVYSDQGWTVLKSKILLALQTYHTQHPLRRGVPTQEIRSRSGLSQGYQMVIPGRLMC